MHLPFHNIPPCFTHSSSIKRGLDNILNQIGASLWLKAAMPCHLRSWYAMLPLLEEFPDQLGGMYTSTKPMVATSKPPNVYGFVIPDPNSMCVFFVGCLGFRYRLSCCQCQRCIDVNAGAILSAEIYVQTPFEVHHHPWNRMLNKNLWATPNQIKREVSTNSKWAVFLLRVCVNSGDFMDFFCCMF